MPAIRYVQQTELRAVLMVFTDSASNIYVHEVNFSSGIAWYLVLYVLQTELRAHAFYLFTDSTSGIYVHGVYFSSGNAWHLVVHVLQRELRAIRTHTYIVINTVHIIPPTLKINRMLLLRGNSLPLTFEQIGVGGWVGGRNCGKGLADWSSSTTWNVFALDYLRSSLISWGRMRPTWEGCTLAEMYLMIPWAIPSWVLSASWTLIPITRW